MFAVNDLDAAIREFEERGIAILTKIETRFCRFALINGTEGNVVNLHRLKTKA